MDDVGRSLMQFVIFAGLVFLSALFAYYDGAIASISKNKLKTLVDEDDLKAQKILNLKEKQTNFMSWINASSYFCLILSCAYGTYAFSYYTSKIIWRLPSSALISTFITLLVVIFVAYVFGNGLPKKLSTKDPQRVAFSLYALMNILKYIFMPLTFLMVQASKGIALLCGVNFNLQRNTATEEEIRMIVEDSNEYGSIEEEEREMINNIFEFDDKSAGDVMTHRTDLVAVEQNADLNEVIAISIDEGFSRIPVYEDNIDNIIGVLYIKDLLPLLINNEFKNKTIKDFLRDATYVPESARCGVLFKDFQARKNHMAVVVDEYGGTAGIVTMEDLIETILGNIQDEYDSEDEIIEKIDDENYSLDGSIDIEDVEKLFDLEIDADEDTDTLGGLIVDILGRIPTEHEHPSVMIENIKFTVANVEDRRIMRVNAHIEAPVMENEEEE